MPIDPKNLPLVVGQKVTITFAGNKFDGAVRGWRAGQYVMVDLPTINGEPLRLVTGAGCDVHFIKDGEYFTFRGTVQCSVALLSMVAIQFSKTIETHNLRKDKRLKVSYPGEISYVVGDKTFTEPCLVRDLSHSGALITHKTLHPKGEKIFVSIPLGTGSLSNQEAIVRNVRNNPKTDSYVTGVMFSSPTGVNREALEYFLASQITESVPDHTPLDY